ncbi:MAG TPA: translation initiation factor IF-2 [Gemmatimonadaceae bacterium]|nr:translation initiation factor IF-2 [Gemmatimonadaceae bacterium]
MSKLRVHDLAGEFGVPTEDVINVLRAIDVPVRSHLTVLTDDQVARVRARWEREKRALKEKAAAPTAAPSRRRKGAAAASTPPAPVPVAEPAGVRRRRRVEPVVAEPVPDETSVATEVAPPAEAPGEAETVETEEVEVAAEAPVAAPPPPPPPPAPPVARPAPPPQRPQQPIAHQAPQQERPRPRPIAPGPARPRPGPGSSPFVPPRPVASATPQGSVGLPSRDKRGGGPPPSTQQQGRRKKGKRGAVDMDEVQQTVFRTMSQMRGTVPAKKGVRRPEESREDMEAARQAEVERERKTVRVNEFITVSELADILKVPATQIVGFAFKNLGLMVTINQRLDFDQIELIAGEFGFQAVREQEYAADVAEQQVVDTAEELESRPPVVTIMGHVDHGKTSLLDYIRKANVVAGESGGITQHIGAYHVELPNGKRITFLDTPGHQAFTAMRARGAQVTDIVVLVVAANDSVMPQTIEAISHAKNAGVPLIVAINKIDLPDANANKVSQDLLQHGVVLEQFGGQTLSTAISAKKGTNVSELLDQILLQSELLDLKANPNRHAVGAVIEAQLDPGKGPVATILVQNGTLRVGDDFISGIYSGRVRALLDERGRQVKAAGPAIPVQVLGLQGVPMAGDQFLVVEDSLQARDIAQRRERLEREARSRRTSKAGVTLEDFMAQTEAGEKRTLRMLIKADQGGPAEALADALQQLSNAEVAVEVVHRGVGAITESDILLARTAGAIIVGFHVRPDNNARAAAEREGVDIKLYRVIYDAVNDVKSALEGMLRPEEKEVILGEAEVREIFKISRVGTIAGCHVRSGIMSRTGKVRVIRDGVEVYDGNFLSLRRFKDDVKEVKEGYECGIGIENFNDIKVADVIECYRREEVARTLAGDGKRGA